LNAYLPESTTLYLTYSTDPPLACIAGIANPEPLIDYPITIIIHTITTLCNQWVEHGQQSSLDRRTIGGHDRSGCPTGSRDSVQLLLMKLGGPHAQNIHRDPPLSQLCGLGHRILSAAFYTIGHHQQGTWAPHMREPVPKCPNGIAQWGVTSTVSIPAKLKGNLIGLMQSKSSKTVLQLADKRLTNSRTFTTTSIRKHAHTEGDLSLKS